MHDNDTDSVGLSETRLDESIRDHEVLKQGYNIFRNDRDVNAGGVAIRVKDTLPVPKIKQKSNKLELMSLEKNQENTKPFS